MQCMFCHICPLINSIWVVPSWRTLEAVGSEFKRPVKTMFADKMPSLLPGQTFGGRYLAWRHHKPKGQDCQTGVPTVSFPYARSDCHKTVSITDIASHIQFPTDVKHGFRTSTESVQADTSRHKHTVISGYTVDGSRVLCQSSFTFNAKAAEYTRIFSWTTRKRQRHLSDSRRWQRTAKRSLERRFGTTPTASRKWAGLDCL